MTVRYGGFPVDYDRHNFDSPGGYDDRHNAEGDTYGVPRMVLPLSGLELQQLRSFQKNVDLPKFMSVTSTPACSLPRAKSFGMSKMKHCETLLKRLMSHQHGWLFKTPVDVVKLNIPDYFTIIKHPMDLGTVKTKLTSGTYSNPSDFSADVYNMAHTLTKFFEVGWKTFEKKSSGTYSEPTNLGTYADKETVMPEPLAKKRKMSAVNHDCLLEPAKRVMADEDRVKLGRDLGSLTEFPVHIINFLRDHSSNEGGFGDDEIEIDINELSHDALFQLRDLFDEYLIGNNKKDSNGELCELELLHGSGPGNSLMQHCDETEFENEDVDVGEYEHPRSRSHITSVRTDIASVGGLNQLEDASKGKLSHVEGVGGHKDGNSAQNEKQLPPEKRYRAALLKNRFADIILKAAQEKTLNQNEKRSPEKLRLERMNSNCKRRKEAEEARRKAKAQAAAEAKRKLEHEREAARQALLEMEKSVEINDNSRFLKDLELVNTDHLTNLREVGHDSDGLGVFGFGGSNPLEQLGLYMKHDEDEDEDEVDLLAFDRSHSQQRSRRG
ncbi:hypothetical protein CARUB_v10013379mg [Capsella rubella]|uniref:Bromo domain-containing protein n=1 Tax=Capsella rubella TaxID=81985 RepID=R0G433_9BRAS|nr:hypothetical protein CARUB_v10013379mg [Capsella rubella]